MLNGKRTYGEFLQSREKIATNVLAGRLSVLEETGIVEKKAFPGNKVKNLYELTPKGIDLMPVLFEMVLWGDKYFEITERAQTLAREIRKDRKGLTKAISKRLAGGGAKSA